MLETFAALFLAHAIADFILQTRRMVDAKSRPAILLLHMASVFLLSALALGVAPRQPDAWIALAALTLIHGAMDVLKTRAMPRGKLWPFLLDQGVHVVTIIAVATLFPGLMAGGLWGAHLPDWLPRLTSTYLVGGFGIFAVMAGGYAVQLLLTPLGTAPAAPPAIAGVPMAGMRIGQLERGLVFLLMLIGQPAGIAFLIAAKSILRFGDIQHDRAASEYVIIGTLASVGWALLAAAILLMLLPEATLAALRARP